MSEKYIKMTMKSSEIPKHELDYLMRASYDSLIA